MILGRHSIWTLILDEDGVIRNLLARVVRGNHSDMPANLQEIAAKMSANILIDPEVPLIFSKINNQFKDLFPNKKTPFDLYIDLEEVKAFVSYMIEKGDVKFQDAWEEVSENIQKNQEIFASKQKLIDRFTEEQYQAAAEWFISFPKSNSQLPTELLGGSSNEKQLELLKNAFVNYLKYQASIEDKDLFVAVHRGVGDFKLLYIVDGLNLILNASPQINISKDGVRVKDHTHGDWEVLLSASPSNQTRPPSPGR